MSAEDATDELVIRPAVSMRHIVATPYVVALGICDAQDSVAIAWPFGLVDAATGEPVGELRAHAGYDDEGMFVRVGLVPSLAPHVVAHVRERVDAWARALACRPSLGPLAPILSDYANQLAWLGGEVELAYPNGRTYAQGSFAGVDVWGRATVRLDSGQELEFPPEQFLMRAAGDLRRIGRD